MKRKLIKPTIFSHCMNKAKDCICNNSRFKCLFSLLILSISSFTVIHAQIVNYNYDSSGNITAKKVIPPKTTASLGLENDSIQSPKIFFADNQVNSKTNSNSTLHSQTNELFYDTWILAYNIKEALWSKEPSIDKEIDFDLADYTDFP